jgi:Na+-transporting NADH:ubiquinone oxidoreductase subunit NqrB
MGTHEETCFSVGFRMQHKRPSNMLIFVAEFFVINSKEIFQYKNPNIFFPCSIIRRFTLSTQREI